MIMDAFVSKLLCFLIFTVLLTPFKPAAVINDWAEWRGPARDGHSSEKGLPNHWSPKGENLAWRAAFGGRSAPIVMGDRVYLQNSVGKNETLQERVMCFNADTGKLVWEHRFNVYMSDVPPHRVGWASPVGDPATGNVFVYGGGGTLLSLSSAGKVIWERSLGEDFGLWTTHGGRTVSPIIEGDLVIVSGVSEGWGEQAPRRHRFFAFDKKTGETMWVSTPGGRPYDTTYSPPIAANINGTRLIIAGAGDGAVHAIKAQTGEPVWNFVMAKRGINTGVVLKGTTAIVSHSEENLDTNEMGLLAALDATAKGSIGKNQLKWNVKNFQGGFSSPVIDGERIYQIDNGANLFAFDVNTGKQLWTLNLGTIQKSSPVLADGKLYVGTENGKFFILKPGPDKCEILDEDELGAGSEGTPETIIASVAISRGRIFLVSDSGLYCIGKKSSASAAAPASTQEAAPAGAQVAHVQVVPTELTLKPGQTVRFRARLFDAQGRFIREDQPTWSLDQVGGTIQPDGSFNTPTDATGQAGLVKAAVGQVIGAARVRIVPALPISENFDSIAVDKVPPYWINTDGKYVVREVDGNKVLMKRSDQPVFKRARAYIGPSDWANYTVEADVRVVEKRRQMGDAGVVAQRYSLVLFGNHQRLELQSWQPETARTSIVPFAWKADTWYRLKLQVENLPDGKTRVRGKAWAAAEAEPSAWNIEKVDTMPNRQGSPGIYADAPFEVYFDNVKVAANK